MNCKSTSYIVLHYKYSRTLVYFSSHQEEQKRTGCRGPRAGQDAEDTEQGRMRERTQSRTGCGRGHRRELDAGQDTGQDRIQEKTQQGGRAGVHACAVDVWEVCITCLWNSCSAVIEVI